jgi:hypothetical protein
MSNIVTPRLDAIIPVTSEVAGAAKNIFAHPALPAGMTAKLLEVTKEMHWLRLDDPANPLIKEDGQGRKVMYMLWGHPDPALTLDPDYMVAIICPLVHVNNNTKLGYKPETVIRGNKIDFIAVGGMSCCSGSLQLHWSQITEKGIIDESRVPVSGLPHPEEANWLKARIRVVTDDRGRAALQHLSTDMLHHRLPNDHRFAHNCGGGADYTAYASSLGTQRLG